MEREEGEEQEEGEGESPYRDGGEEKRSSAAPAACLKTPLCLRLTDESFRRLWCQSHTAFVYTNSSQGELRSC